jgi:hypothetical protein
MISVTPVLRVYVQASLSIPFIPEPSIEGQLDLLRLDAPVMARMRWEVNQSPEVCAVRLLADSKYNVTISSLNGRIFLVLKLVIFNPFGDNLEIELARIEVLSFDGISFSTGYKDLFSAQILPSIPLDANQCLVGGLGCTEMAPDRVFMPPPSSSVPGQGDTGRDYGSDKCPGQFVWELPVEPDIHLKAFVIGADIGDISDAEAPCEQRKAAVTMWQHVNGAWTEATRFRLVGGRTPGGKCMVTAVNRSAPNPLIPDVPPGDSFNTLPDSDPFQRFPFVPGMDKIRVAMAAAVGCTPLPLSFSPAMLRVF